MEKKALCLFLVGLWMIASLTQTEACKKCGIPMCPGVGSGMGMMPMGGLGGHPLLGGGFGGNPMLGGGLGGHPLLGGFGGYPMFGGGLGGNPLMGGLGGQGVGYPVPYPVAVPVPVASPFPPPHHEFRSMGPIDGGYFEEYIPRRRVCRCHLQSHGIQPRRHPALRGRSYGDYY